MIDGKVLLIALIALCGANLAMIWQISTLTDRVRDARHELHGIETVLMRMLRKDLESYDDED